jgi:hypothetical protein
MREVPEPAVNPETPWEFFPEDVRPREPVVAPEEAAMHVEHDESVDTPPGMDPYVVVHYNDDEHPEVVDRSEPVVSDDNTPPVDSLLARQHYLLPNDRRTSPTNPPPAGD